MGAAPGIAYDKHIGLLKEDRVHIELMQVSFQKTCPYMTNRILASDPTQNCNRDCEIRYVPLR